MSGCADVCLDHYYDSDENEFYSEVTPKARKEHQCCECAGVIQVGQQYQRVKGKADGAIWTAVTCLVCRDIRNAFVCGSWVFGQLWESIEEGMFPVWETSGPIDCLAKLDTLEARNECRERYRDWKEQRL